MRLCIYCKKLDGYAMDVRSLRILLWEVGQHINCSYAKLEVAYGKLDDTVCAKLEATAMGSWMTLSVRS